MDSGCLFCGEPATRLCDAMIARPIGDYSKSPGRAPHPVMTMDTALLGRCDAPCCTKHAKQVGHICGGDDGCESIDHCVKCVGRQSRLPMLTPDKIPGMRRDLHRKWRLEGLHVVPVEAPST